MSTSHALPSELQPWSSALSFLDVEFATALGPLIRHLDQFVSRIDLAHATSGELDGYDGITTRGGPHRLLTSEWSIADEAPNEFLRRAVMAELLYLAPGHLDEHPRGRVSVLVDCGPHQLGAARLVQLAALIVLDRRARSRGGELSLGLLGDSPCSWRSGDAQVLLPAWLATRRASEPSVAEVEAWLPSVGKDDETWLLTGTRLADDRSRRLRTLVLSEAAWDASGPTAVDVRLGADHTELALPRHDLAIRALRGAAFNTKHQRTARPPARHGMRFPAFMNARARLLGRGELGDELVTVQLQAPTGTGRPRRHRVSGTVVSAGFAGRRTLALVLKDGGRLRLDIVGKPLPGGSEIAASVEQVGLTEHDVHSDADKRLEPAYMLRESLLCRLRGTWWILSSDGVPTPRPDILAVAPGEFFDQPRIAERRRDAVMVSDHRAPLPAATDILLGPQGTVAWRLDDEPWTVSPSGDRITVPAGTQIAGLTMTSSGPALVGVSAAGHVLRLCRPSGTTALTTWSGDIVSMSVHASRPWLAIQRPDGEIDVVDVNDRQPMAHLTAVAWTS
ncbi:MAG TPA: hypothetical protein VIP77_17140 [Jiangellaceae bacterium]